MIEDPAKKTCMAKTHLYLRITFSAHTKNKSTVTQNKVRREVSNLRIMRIRSDCAFLGIPFLTFLAMTRPSKRSKHLQYARSFRKNSQSSTLVSYNYILASVEVSCRNPCNSGINETDVDEIEAYTLADDDFDEFFNDSQPKEAILKWIDGAKLKARAPYHGESRATKFKKQ